MKLSIHSNVSKGALPTAAAVAAATVIAATVIAATVAHMGATLHDILYTQIYHLELT